MKNNNRVYDKSLSSVTGRPATPEEIAYRDGYVQGRSIEANEQDIRYENERWRAREEANNSAASGLILGLLIATIAGIIGAIFYFNREAEPVTEIEPVVPEQVENNTVIERTIERTQEVVPAEPPEVTLPEVDVNLPPVAPESLDASDSSETSDTLEAPVGPETQSPEATTEPAPETAPQ